MVNVEKVGQSRTRDVNDILVSVSDHIPNIGIVSVSVFLILPISVSDRYFYLKTDTPIFGIFFAKMPIFRPLLRYF